MIIKIMIITLMVIDHHDHHHHPHDVPANFETNQQKQVIEAKATENSYFVKYSNTPPYYILQSKHSTILYFAMQTLKITTIL